MSRVLPWILLAATALVFLPVLHAGFVFDDASLVEHNRWTAEWSAIPRAFQHHLWASGPDGDPSGPFYRPLLLVSLTLDRQLFGLSAPAAHLHSLAWHLLCVGLFWRFLAGLGRPGAAATAAVIFALHPVVVEPVAFIAARNDPMATAAALCMLIACERPGAGRSAAGAALLLAALLCKESALAALPLLLLVDWARGGRLTPWPRLLALLGAIGAWAALRAGADIAPMALAFNAEDLRTALGVYLGLSVWPPGGGPAAELALAEPPWIPALLALIGWTLLAIRGGRWGVVGLLWAGLALAPALGGALSAGFLAHRYLYLPLAGLGLCAFAGLPARADRPMAALLGLVLAVGSSTELRYWSDNRVFFERAFALSPSSRNACGVFKALEAHPEAGDPGPWLRRALSPPPSEHCCFNASRWPLDTGRPALSVELGTLALQQGCPESPELLAPLAFSAALGGDWDRAEALAARLSGDPWGYSPVIRAAAALRRGDEAPLVALEAQSDQPVRERVAWMLSQAP